MTGQQRKALGDDRGVEEMTRSSDVYPRVLRFQTHFKRHHTKGQDKCNLLGFRGGYRAWVSICSTVGPTYSEVGSLIEFESRNKKIKQDKDAGKQMRFELSV